MSINRGWSQGDTAITGIDTMRKLSGMDATFLYMETDETPMHISSLLICEPKKKGENAYEALKAHTVTYERESDLEDGLNSGVSQRAGGLFDFRAGLVEGTADGAHGFGHVMHGVGVDQKEEGLV